MKKIITIIVLVLVAISASGQVQQQNKFHENMKDPMFKSGVVQMTSGGLIIASSFAINALVYFAKEYTSEKEEMSTGCKILMGAVCLVGVTAGTALIIRGYTKVNQYNKGLENRVQPVQHCGPVFTIKF